MWRRNFKASSVLFMESISTFTCTELMSFNEFVFYTIIVGTFSLSRPDLKSQVVDSSDVLGAIKEIPASTKNFLFSLYNCDYKQYLISLVDVVELLSKNRYMAVHANYYCREMRIAGFTQFLVSYKSIKISHMAQQFGVSVDFLDNELSNFIGAGRLYCKIDKVEGIIETTRLDQKNELYQNVIKLGDHLLNRIHKLSRVTDL
jgi:26S proteasome regulatory subunit N7